MEELVFTVPEVAEILKCNEDYVHRLRKKGLIHFMKLGSFKCRRAEIERFLSFAEGKDFTDLNNITEIQN